MPDRYDPLTDEWTEYEVPSITVPVTDNPVTHMLYGPNGQVIREWRARNHVEFGFKKPNP